jgi:asparagine synthase (glutamine-hydrolysing)
VCGIGLIVGPGIAPRSGAGGSGTGGPGETLSGPGAASGSGSRAGGPAVGAADQVLFRRMLDSLAPRGEVEETVCEPGVLAGTQRLRIVDRERAAQPWQSADGRWLLCYNGELFNHRELRAELVRLGREFRSESDTEVVLEAFAHWGEGAVARFRGEFAFAVVDRANGRTYLARDPVGVKPLYWSARAGRLYVASEVKALVPAGLPVSEVPPGHHGWVCFAGAAPILGPLLTPYVNLQLLGRDTGAIEDPAEAAKQLRLALEDSVRVRVDTDLSVGVILSGGLDSSLVLLHVREMHPDCVALTIGSADSEDVYYARRLAADLRVRHEIVSVSDHGIGHRLVREAIRMSELTEYGDIINAVVSVPLFARARELGIKVVLTGDGSDELFGGYAMYGQIGPSSSRRLFQHKIMNLHRTELQRVDRVSMAHGVEARVPFLDLALVELAMRIPAALKIREGQEKWIVRHAFRDMLPAYILERPKNPMSHSSGLHERARLYRPLFARIQRSFGYDRLDPVRRDFSVVLDKCGYDLDRAVAVSRARPDYGPTEHARDLAGALRWNAVTALRRVASPPPGPSPSARLSRPNR